MQVEVSLLPILLQSSKMLLPHWVWSLETTASFFIGNTRPSVLPFQCPWLILARDDSTVTSPSSPQLVCRWWWFRLGWERVQLPHRSKAKVPITVLCQCLEAAYFQSYWLFSFFTQQNIMSLSHPPTTTFFIQLFQECLYFWSYSDLIFLVAWGLEVGIPTCTIKSCSLGLWENQVPLLQDDECSSWEDFGKKTLFLA